MLSTERAEFETQLGILFAGFPTFLTPQRVEAYWMGLQKMPLQMFTRCVEEALGESGEEKLPTPNLIWKISKRLRAANIPKRDQSTKEPAPVTCRYRAYGNQVLLAYLMRFPAPDPELLNKMVAQKNHIADAYACICAEEPDACKEILQQLITSLNKITGCNILPHALRVAIESRGATQ